MPDLSVLALTAGETVPHFAEWHPLTQKAMLDQCWVRWAADGKLSPHEEVMASKGVHQPVPHGPLGTPLDRLPKKEREPALFKPALPELRPVVVDGSAPEAAALPAAEVVVAVADDIMQPARAPLLNDGVVVSAAPPTGKGAHDCPYCARAGFKDYNGLRVHMARAHKDA